MRNTGNADQDVPEYEYSLLWSLEFSSPITSSPAIDEGEVFLVVNTSQSDEPEYTLVCLDLETKEEKWRFEEREEIQSHPYLLASPLVTNDLVYASLADGYMYAVDRNTGDEIWSYDTGSPICSSPVIHDGVVFFGGTWSHTLYALDAEDGSEIWTFREPESAIVSSPAVYNKMVFFGSWDNKFYAVDEEGNNDDIDPTKWGTTDLIWAFETEWRIYSTPLVHSDSVFFTGPDEDKYQHVFALDHDSGEIKWSYNTTQKGPQTCPAIQGSVIYVGTEVSNLIALYVENGTPMWIADARCSVSSPSIAGKNMILGNFDGIILKCNLLNGEMSEISSTGRYIASSPAIYEEYFVINSNDNKTYCFKGTEIDSPPIENGTHGNDDDSLSFTHINAAIAITCAVLIAEGKKFIIK